MINTQTGTPLRLGIDLGGTKIEAVVLAQDNHELFRQRCATPQGDYHATLQQIQHLVQSAQECVNQVCSIGIGIPGAISAQTGLVKNANSTCLIGRNLQSDLEKLLGQPVRIANDADCFTLSESCDGAGAQASIVFGVILGTGVGGGLCINQQLICGPNRITGEWGHNPLPWPGLHDEPKPDCYCGKQGCIEAYLSGPALSRSFLQRFGQSLSGTEIHALSQEDSRRNVIMEDYSDRLARSLAGVINILDPEIIVLGGGLSNIQELYPMVQDKLPRYVFSDTVETQVKQARHGDSSGVRGAAWLWNSE